MSLAYIAPMLLVINAAWFVLNLSLMNSMRKEFPTRPECDGKHALVDERQHELCRRLEKANI